MSEEDIKKMWAIDSKFQLGDKVTEEEKEFFNSKYGEMLSEMYDNYVHWQHHVSKF